MLKKIAILLNTVLIIFWIYLFISKFQYQDIKDWLLFIGVILFPVLNIVAITNNSKKSGFISLFFRRKTLEEKKKIQELENK